MRRLHILLASPTREGLAVPVCMPQQTVASAHTHGLAARLEGQSKGLFDSLRQAGDLAWRVLMGSPTAAGREADNAVRFYYRLETPGIEAKVDEWGSADLAFFVTVLLDRLALACNEAGQPISSLAATGHLFGLSGSDVAGSAAPAVCRVGGIASKLQAALSVLAPLDTARILIPLENLEELPPEHHDWVRGGVIVPVRNLEDVLDVLKALPVLPKAMREILHDLHAPLVGNPYRGIQAFGIGHRGQYFGRRKQIDEVLRKLPDTVGAELPAVLITGYSGSGKSSLMLAGVLGTVLHAGFKGHRFLPSSKSVPDASVVWRVSARSGFTETSLCEELTAHWQCLLGANLPPVSTLNALADSLVPLLVPSQERPGHWVFALDQLEALVTQVDPCSPAFQELHGLLDRLADMLERLIREAGVWVIATLRPEYLATIGPLWSRIFHAGGYVDLSQPVSREAAEVFLREVIERPARLAGFTLEERLAERLMSDTEDLQALPLLEFALHALYAQASRRNSAQMTHADYEDIGGIPGAINRRAEQLLPEEPQGRDALLGSLSRLARERTNANGQREHVRAAVAWESYTEAEQRRLQAWFSADHRLLTRYGDQIEVAHEALLREFTALREWLLRNEQMLRWRQDHLLPQMKRWAEQGKSDNHLMLSDDDLAEGRSALENGRILGHEEASFVEASLVAANRRTEAEERNVRELDDARQRAAIEQKRALRRTRIGLAVATVLLALAVWAGLTAWQAAVKEKKANAIAEKQLDEAAARAYGRARDALDEGDSRKYVAFLAESLAFAEKPSSLYAAAAALNEYFPPKGEWRIRAVMRHEGVQTAKFSPDGRWIVSASNDNSAHVWDAQTGIAIGRPMRHANNITSVMFSPDSRWVVSASNDNSAQIWDAQTGIVVGEPMRHEDRIRSVMFSPDSRSIVTTSGNTARVWDVQTRKVVGEPMRHKGDPRFNTIESAQFSSDGRWIVTAARYDGARVWDARTGDAVGEPIRDEGALESAMFSPDNHWIVTVGTDARIWNANTRRAVGKPLGAEYGVRSAQISPDSRWIVTIDSMVYKARIWDAQTGIARGEPMQDVASAKFSPDGRWIVTAGEDGFARVWDAQTGTELAEPMRHGGKVESASFSPDGLWVVTTSDDGIVRIWEASIGALSMQMPNEYEVPYARFSPDGRWIVTMSYFYQVWNAQTGKEGELRGCGHDMQKLSLGSAEFSPDGRWIATTCDDKTVRVWDVQKGIEVGEPMRHEAEVTSVAFSPDGRWIVTASVSFAQIWDVQKHTVIGEPMFNLQGFASVMFSPNGRWIVSTAGDRALVWDVQTRKIVGEPMHHDANVTSAMFSPDGRWIVTASGNVAQVWDVQARTIIGKPMHHDANVTWAMFSPDGRWIVTASGNLAKVWDVKTRTVVGEPMHHNAEVTSAMFSPDGQWIATEDAEFSPKFWYRPTDLGTDGKLLATALRALYGAEIDRSGRFRKLSPDEAKQARDSLQQFADSDTPFGQVIRWHFADRSIRTISPFSQQTVSQFVENSIESALSCIALRSLPVSDPCNPRFTHRLLRLAYEADPSHPLILLALSAFEDNTATLRLWKDLTLKRIVNDARLATRAAELLRQEGDFEYARRAAQIALSLDETSTLSKAVLDWANANAH